MDWWGGKVSLGSLDLAGAVNKLQESVKNIEMNFDSALGLEDKPQSSNTEPEESASWSSTNRKALFDPVMSFMGQQEEEDRAESEVGKNSHDEEESVMSKDEEESVKGKDEESIKGKDDDESVKSKDEDESVRSIDVLPKQLESTQEQSLLEGEKGNDADVAVNPAPEPTLYPGEGNVDPDEQKDYVGSKAVEEAIVAGDFGEAMPDLHDLAGDFCEAMPDLHDPTASVESTLQVAEIVEFTAQINEENKSNVEFSKQPESPETKVQADKVDQDCGHTDNTGYSSDIIQTEESIKEPNVDRESPQKEELSSGSQDDEMVQNSETSYAAIVEPRSPTELEQNNSATEHPSGEAPDMVSDQASEQSSFQPEILNLSIVNEVDAKEHRLSSDSNVSDSFNATLELEKLKREMKMMESALQGAARQAQAKADDIAKLMNENEQLKSALEDLRRKSNDAEIESLREEYHQRVATLERKVYALTKERDTLRREQNKRSDAAALLKEKDEIITQVMAEGEELSKKQAAQEAQMRKLRAQIRELEEEKKTFITKLQLEENKVESIKKDKGATEKLLQETVEKHQAELAAQKEYFTSALNAAKEAEALAEARANNEARTEVEGRLREAEERESMLIQALEELRQTISRQEQQEIVKEDMLRREIEDLQKRYQASERRCEELVTQLPESTRPLLRQIEAMQEASSQKAEAWAAVERTLQSRLQEAEAKAAVAEERERSVNERLSQTLSRINVLEAQISCLRAEQTQLNRSLEKERQRAAENRQEYLAAKEEADTHVGRASQLEEEIRELKRKHKKELQESLAHRELLQQELEREKEAKLELEKAVHVQSTSVSDQSPTLNNSTLENGKLMRRLSNASSVGNMEESFFLQASLDSTNLLERRNSGEASMSPYYLKSMTPSAFEAALRQKEGELASYMTRLASMESIRDSLAEELVKMTEQCEKLRTEATMLPGVRAELDALRQRHTAALELMGERDEELEELRADIMDLKEMYKEQVNLLVNKIQFLSSQMGAS